MSGAPARGTAPRRPRRHHHHHHHHHNNNREDELHRESASNYVEKSHSKANEENRPKVNPIFLWALQREQRIIEVRCEDYDKRNRIKLTKTAHGWRSIPRTASNVYTTDLSTNGHSCCIDRTCESPAAAASFSSATSSPNSSRWSPATISSSHLAPWSVSSTRSSSGSCCSSSHLTTISSPSRESSETIGAGDSSSIASRLRNQSDGESINDFDDSCSTSATKLRQSGKALRERRHGRQSNRASEVEKGRKRMDSAREAHATLHLGAWNNGTENNENNSEEDSTKNFTEVEEMCLERAVDDGGTSDTTRKKRRRGRNVEADKRKRHRRNSESQDATELSVMSSPRSWERLMNGTRFLSSGPTVDRLEAARKDEEAEDAGKPDRDFTSTLRANHFGSIDLERAKTDQHLQPRVVLEPLRLPGALEGGKRDVATLYEDDVVKEVAEAEEEEAVEEAAEKEAGPSESGQKICNVEKMCGFSDRGQKDTACVSDKSGIRDILSMLDSTGSPVLATDTPTAHLPSPLDSTKTNISSCYENRDCAKQSRQRPPDETNMRLLPVASHPEFGRCGANNSIPDFPKVRSFEDSNWEPMTRSTTQTPGSTKISESPSGETERAVNGKINRRENVGEMMDSSCSELSTSSEILEALRSTPGLSVSITTRINTNEVRQDVPEHAGRNQQKRPTTVHVEKLLPNLPQKARRLASAAPCYGSAEVTCSQEPGNELTLEAILATTVQSSEKQCGPGLAAIVNRLSNRTTQHHALPDHMVGRTDGRTDDARLKPLSGQKSQDRRTKKNNIENKSEISGSSRCLENVSQPIRNRRHCHSREDDGSERKKYLSRTAPPAKQLRYLMRNSSIRIPDPLLVPRNRLPALAAAPAVEIPKLLTARPELRLPEALTRPDLLRDPDLLVISLAHLQQVLDQGDEGSVREYTYRPPHPMALVDDDDEEDEDDDDDDEFCEEDELVEEGEESEDVDDDEEEEDQDVPEQSLDLDRKESLDAARVGGGADDKRKNNRIPPKLISCKPIGSLMPGPIDLSRHCSAVRSLHPTRFSQSFTPGSRQPDVSMTPLPPPPLLRVRSGLLKQEHEVTSTEIPSPCLQDDSHLWHPLFGSQKRQMQRQQQQQQQQQTHRTSWHRTTLAS